MSEQASKKRRNDVHLDQDNWDRPDEPQADAEQGGQADTKATPEELAKRRKVVVQRRADGSAVQKGANPFASVNIASSTPNATESAKVSTQPEQSSNAATTDPPTAPQATAAPASDADSAPPANATATASVHATGFSSLSAKAEGGFQFGGGASNGAFPANSSTTAGRNAAAGAFGSTTFGTLSAGGFGGGTLFGANSAGGTEGDAAASDAFGAGSGGTIQLFSGKKAESETEGAGRSVHLSNEKPATGEEDETVLFASDATLFVFGPDKAWKDRGKGEVRVNRMPDGQARIVMRQKGNFRLMLNANLFPAMSVQVMEGGRGVTFNCVNVAIREEVSQIPVEASGMSSEAAVVQGDTSIRVGANDASGAANAATTSTAHTAPDEDANDTASVKDQKPTSSEAVAATPPATASATTAPSMVLHALRLRPADQQDMFIRVLNENKAPPATVVDEAGAWVPPV